MDLTNPSSSTAVGSETYDVFPSFRGADLRHGFVGHLRKALEDNGFRTFLDDEEIQRGKEIGSELKRAIQQSKISIVVFSENYIFSSWCLDELIMIIEHNRNLGLNDQILPIFYDVDPSHLRKQTGIVGNAFLVHERQVNDETKIKKWKESLYRLANIAGETFNSKFDGYECKFIQKIIEVVKTRFPWRPIRSSDFQVIGMVNYIESIIKWLNKSTNTNILVIRGIGGSGKTTIAELIYSNNILKFDGGSFLKFGHVLKKDNGKTKLQAKLLSDILRQPMTKKPCTILGGWDKIKRVLCSRKVLLVLDDVDQPAYSTDIIQLKNCLSKGSKIVITTRLRNLLEGHDHIKRLQIDGLSHADSLQLFSLHAFVNRPNEDFHALAINVVHHCQGNPLALKVLGSCLFGKSLFQWKNQLQKLKETSHREIYEILKLSYDSLEDNDDKNIFLDVACFFVGKERDFITTILQGCYKYVETRIDTLIDRCLLEKYGNRLRMHNLIQCMGYKIVRDTCKKFPEKCNRLWNHEDALEVIRFKKGTKYIEGLILDMRNSSFQDLEFSAFEGMDELRLLCIDYALFNGSYKMFPRSLKWLS